MTKVYGAFLLLVAILTLMWATTMAFLFWQNNAETEFYEQAFDLELAASDAAFRAQKAATALAENLNSGGGGNRDTLIAHLMIIGDEMAAIKRLERRKSTTVGPTDNAFPRVETAYNSLVETLEKTTPGLPESNRNLAVFVDRIGQYRDLRGIDFREQLRVGRRVVADDRSDMLIFLIALAVVCGGAVFWNFRHLRHTLMTGEAAAAALKESEIGLSEAQSTAHLGSWNWDIVGESLTWSDEIYRIFGLQPQQFGATYEAFLEFVHPDDRDAVAAAVNGSLETGAPYRIEHRTTWSDSTLRWVEEQGQAHFADDGSPLRMTGTVQDITDRKIAEDEVRALNENLEHRVEERTSELATANKDLHTAMDQLKRAQGQLVESEKMASLGGLVAGVAHEINTPVGIGVTAVTHLREATGGFRAKFEDGAMKRRDLERFLGTAEQSTEIIFSNLKRASNLINSFKQVAVDQSSEDRRTFNVREYFDEIVLSLRPRLKKTSHTVSINCDADLVLDSYPGAYSQILTNLIMNSLIHAYGKDEAGAIDIDLQADKDGIMLVYSDDGKGMNEEQTAKVFEPFFTTNRGGGGSGLGMNIVYNLVTQKLNGAITCESTPGEGATFRIATPVLKGKLDDRCTA